MVTENGNQQISAIVAANQRLLYCCADDNNAYICHAVNGKLRVELRGHTDTVKCCDMAPNEWCVTGSTDQTLRVWNVSDGACQAVLKGHAAEVRLVH